MSWHIPKVYHRQQKEFIGKNIIVKFEVKHRLPSNKERTPHCRVDRDMLVRQHKAYVKRLNQLLVTSVTAKINVFCHS